MTPDDDTAQFDFTTTAEPARVEPATAPTPEAEPAPPPMPPPAGSQRALTIVLAVALLVAIAVAGLLWRRASDESSRADEAASRSAVLEAAEDQRLAIATTAGGFSEALLTYDFETLDEARDRVLDLATEGFAAEYTEAFAGGLAGAISELEAESSATIRDVYVAEVTGDTAKAIVTLDSEVRSTAGTRRTVSSYLDLTLQLVGDEWKVDSVTSVAALDEERTGPDGPTSATSTSTTATTAP